MRILVLGKNYTALRFVENFAQNKENDVFSIILGTKNFIDFENEKDILDFCLANDINFVLATEEKYINSYLIEDLNANNISVLAPSTEAEEICFSKVFAKRFLHKNQIKTPKFFIAEKLQLALDYLKTAKLPVVIKPDNTSFQEGTLFAETYSQAQTILENFFNSGNKKVIIEDYIEGANVSIWTITDGYKAKIIGTSAKYQNNVALFNPYFIDDEIKNDISETMINPTIKALADVDCEYVGILGFDIILDKTKTPYLVSYNSFFDDINVDFYLKDIDFSWEDVFSSIIAGDVFLKFDKFDFNEHSLTLRINEEINCISANTKTNLKRLLKELEIEDKELEEAKEKWKI